MQVRYISAQFNVCILLLFKLKDGEKGEKKWFGVVLLYNEIDNFGGVLPICQDSARLSRPSPCAWPDPAHAWRSARTGGTQRALKKPRYKKSF